MTLLSRPFPAALTSVALAIATAAYASPAHADQFVEAADGAAIDCVLARGALIDGNRDYYGPVRFDDIDFQMSARGQQLQARFVESYANQLNAEIADDLALPPFASVARPAVSSADGVRGSVRLGGVPGSLGAPSSEREDIARDVGRVQQQGDRRIGTVKGYLDGKTRDAKGASAEAADDVKEW